MLPERFWHVTLRACACCASVAVARQCSPFVFRAPLAPCGLTRCSCDGVCDYVLPCSSVRRFGSEVARVAQCVDRRCNANP